MSQLLHIGQFQSIPVDNNSRHVAKPADLFPNANGLEVLATKLYGGWKIDLGAMLGYVPFNDTPIKGVSGDDKLKTAVELEKEFWDNWHFTDALTIHDTDGNAHKVAKAHVLEAYKKLKGRSTPKYGINTGNRRSFAFVVMNAARIVAGDPIITTIPVEIEEYASEKDRRIANIRSNAGMDGGRKKQDHRDKLSAAFDVLNEGGIESDLYKGANSCQMSRGDAQRCFGIVRLHAANPELELLDRCLDANRDDAVKIEKLDKEELRYLRQGKKEGAVMVREPGTIEEIKAYFDDPKPEGQNEDRMMSKKMIKDLMDVNPNKVVSRILGAILSNNASPIAALAKEASEYNALAASLATSEAAKAPAESKKD